MNKAIPFQFWTNALSHQFAAKLIWGSVVGTGMILGLSSPAIAQITRATITEILDGDEVFVEEGEGASDRVPAVIDTVVEFQETVVTEDSRAALAFDNGAVGRMGTNSRITVGQCIEVQQGILLAAGPANGCTATFAVGVEGTMYAIVKDEDTETHRIQVLEGIVEVALNDESSPEEERIQQIRAGEEVTVGPDGRFRARRTLDRQDIRVLLRSGVFNNFEGVLPDIENLEVTLNNLYPNIKLPCLPGFRNCSGPIRGLF